MYYDVYIGSSPTSGSQVTSPTTFPLDTWTHVALVHNSGEAARIFWNVTEKSNGGYIHGTQSPPAVARSHNYIGGWTFRGEMRDVTTASGAFDFCTKPKLIGDYMSAFDTEKDLSKSIEKQASDAATDSELQQLGFGFGGYDHCYVIDKVPAVPAGRPLLGGPSGVHTGGAGSSGVRTADV